MSQRAESREGRGKVKAGVTQMAESGGGIEGLRKKKAEYKDL